MQATGPDFYLKKKLQNFTQENPTPNCSTNDEMK
jgi:hypothetical protein